MDTGQLAMSRDYPDHFRARNQVPSNQVPSNQARRRPAGRLDQRFPNESWRAAWRSGETR